MNQKVAAIIPAFNEERTVAQVVLAAKSCPLVSEVIVVDDGSSDRTAEEAEKAGAKVVSLFFNQGKGQAMQAGSKKTSASHLLFLDADLVNLNSGHLELLIKSVLDQGFDMAVGSIDRRRWLAWWGALFLRLLSKSQLPLAGTRVVSRGFWESIPDKYKHRFYIESAVSYFAKEKNLKVKTLLLSGLSHLVKEKKRGPVMGVLSRVRMFAQVIWINIFLRFF